MVREKTLAKIRKFWDDGSYQDHWVLIEHPRMCLLDRGCFVQVLGVFEPDRKIKCAERVLERLNKRRRRK